MSVSSDLRSLSSNKDEESRFPKLIFAVVNHGGVQERFTRSFGIRSYAKGRKKKIVEDLLLAVAFQGHQTPSVMITKLHLVFSLRFIGSWITSIWLFPPKRKRRGVSSPFYDYHHKQRHRRQHLHYHTSTRNGISWRQGHGFEGKWFSSHLHLVPDFKSSISPWFQNTEYVL